MLYGKEIIRNMIFETVKKKDPGAEIILFGSRARSQENNDSDWDILILLNNEEVPRKLEKEFRDELYNIELETGEPISTFVFSRSDWEGKHKYTPLYQNIKRDGINLI
jgi:predicted nucleotidyltransferase